MFCKNCGKEIDDRAVVCPGCGVPTAKAEEAPKQKNKLGLGLCIAEFVLSLLSLYLAVYFCITSILAIVLSAIGMHVAKKNGDGCGLGIAGLVIGIITTVFWLLILIFAASLVAAIL